MGSLHTFPEDFISKIGMNVLRSPFGLKCVLLEFCFCWSRGKQRSKDQNGGNSPTGKKKLQDTKLCDLALMELEVLPYNTNRDIFEVLS